MDYPHIYIDADLPIIIDVKVKPNSINEVYQEGIRTMKEKGRKIAGGIIASEGVLDLIIGICERRFSTTFIGIALCITGCLYFFEKRK